MKPILIVLLILAINMSTFAQRKQNQQKKKSENSISCLDLEATSNFLYFYLENPISVVVEQGNRETAILTSKDTSVIITKKGDMFYVNPTIIHKGQISQLTLNLQVGDQEIEKIFFTRRIHDPVPRLGHRSSGKMSSGQFRAQQGIHAGFIDFYFETKCTLVGFMLSRLSNEGEVEMERNQGGKYSESSLNIAQKAKMGDIFLFENIKCKCDGDMVARDIGAMVFRIK